MENKANQSLTEKNLQTENDSQTEAQLSKGGKMEAIKETNSSTQTHSMNASNKSVAVAVPNNWYPVWNGFHWWTVITSWSLISHMLFQQI